MNINELKVGNRIKTVKDVSVNIELFFDIIDPPHPLYITWKYLVEYVSIDYVIVLDAAIGSSKRLLLSSSEIELNHE
jgi:hypothetical protein